MQIKPAQATKIHIVLFELNRAAKIVEDSAYRVAGILEIETVSELIQISAHLSAIAKRTHRTYIR